jgi:hypothetical protein
MVKTIMTCTESTNYLLLSALKNIHLVTQSLLRLSCIPTDVSKYFSSFTFLFFLFFHPNFKFTVCPVQLSHETAPN